MMNGLTLRAELDRYKNSGSVYQSTWARKDGTRPWCIAFYYEDLDGRKQRKVLSSENKDDLEEKRDQFLTELFLEKCRMKEEKAKEQPVISSPSVYMAPPVKQSCGVTVQEAYEKFEEKMMERYEAKEDRKYLPEYYREIGMAQAQRDGKYDFLLILMR